MHTAAGIPNVLSISSVDPTGASGLLADMKSLSALGAYGCGVVVAVLVQDTQAVRDVHPVLPPVLRGQLDALLADVALAAAKTGLLPAVTTITEVADALAARLPPQLVVDPVLLDRRGQAVLDKPVVAALREALLPLATVLTPNLPEAGLLLGRRAPDSVREMQQAAEALREAMTHAGSRWVYLKGGRLTAADSPDLLFDGDKMIELPAPRLRVQAQGAGCALSAALAALLPQCADVPKAARRARQYVAGALAQTAQLNVGQGPAPLHHLHALWR
ncbi:MAG: bifunctional hydroxymethylpyrimidine kinase/phosphomethylpyrimidine kinase [Betaproteobacteria bacterium]